VTKHRIGTQKEWEAARDELLTDEKELTRRGTSSHGGGTSCPGSPGLYHEILNEPEQAKVIDDLVAWLDAHL